jgi:hypothetical protein
MFIFIKSCTKQQAIKKNYFFSLSNHPAFPVETEGSGIKRIRKTIRLHFESGQKNLKKKMVIQRKKIANGNKKPTR